MNKKKVQQPQSKQTNKQETSCRYNKTCLRKNNSRILLAIPPKCTLSFKIYTLRSLMHHPHNHPKPQVCFDSSAATSLLLRPLAIYPVGIQRAARPYTRRLSLLRLDSVRVDRLEGIGRHHIIAHSRCSLSLCKYCGVSRARGIKGLSSSTECHRIRWVISVINVLLSFWKDDHVFAQLLFLFELPDTDVRVEVHALVGGVGGVQAPDRAYWRCFGLSTSSVDVEERVPWVAVNLKVVAGVARWAPAVGIATLAGVLSTAHVLIPTGSPIFDLRNGD
jgi:hypothetical protein